MTSKWNIIVLVALVVHMSSTGSYGLGKSKTPEDEIDDNHLNELKVWLSVKPQSFVCGDTAWFYIYVFNPSKDTVTVILSTPLPARFIVNKNGRPVWRSDYGIAVAQVLTPMIVPPLDTLQLRSFWTGRDNQGNLLPLGKYFVEGCFLQTGKPICFNDTIFIID